MEETPHIPLTGPTADLWVATSANAWEVASASKGNPVEMRISLATINPDSLTESITSPMGRSTRPLCGYKALGLQSQETTWSSTYTGPENAKDFPSTARLVNLFPDCPIANMYLALRRTPPRGVLFVLWRRSGGEPHRAPVPGGVICLTTGACTFALSFSVRLGPGTA